MPRTASFTDGATPPSYVTRAYQYDTTWKKAALCTGHIKPDSPFRKAWITEPSERHRIGDQDVAGSTLIEVALTFCAMCPVQWDCTTWALDVGERAGTWGIPYDDLIWLREQRDPHRVVEAARTAGTAVAVEVTRRRRRIRPVRV